MALQHAAQTHRAFTTREVVRAFLLVMAVIVMLIALFAVFSVHGMGPTYQIAPDPLWPLQP